MGISHGERKRMFNYHLGKCNREELERDILVLKKTVRDLQVDNEYHKNMLSSNHNAYLRGLDNQIKILEEKDDTIRSMAAKILELEKLTLKGITKKVRDIVDKAEKEGK